MDYRDKYETIVGLEVHVQLDTKSKAYCSDANLFGQSPNTCISPISMGYPGTLPTINKEVIKNAIKLGLALNCNITRYNLYARKNYFYPDLPKGYQITQDKTPICKSGYVKINRLKETEKKINLTRIHMEEDAGKSIHDLDPFHSLIDFNRAGVPLLEIVSEPEINSSEEAYQYLYEIRKLVRHIGVSNGNMEEGSLRCDANISVRLKGEKKLRNRVEVKNINSLKNVMKAIELEIERQIKCYENKKEVNQETRNYHAHNNTTTVLRTKEDAHDYRYFPEPDIPPLIIEQSFIDSIKKDMPMLPEDLYDQYTKKYKLSDYDANCLIDEKDLAEMFNDIIKHTKSYKTVANLIMGTIKSYLNEYSLSINELNIDNKHIAELADMVDNNKISHIIISQKLFPKMINSEHSPNEIAKKNGWIQEDDTSIIDQHITQVIAKYPDKVKEYQNGNKNLLGLFMGEIMRETKGKLNPKLISNLLQNRLEK
jgi:aspartyl-tRNA(Asn)/glutamyl-tRNA(Gln) amidotransferase subunit B